jgi:hypothetical protein
MYKKIYAIRLQSDSLHNEITDLQKFNKNKSRILLLKVKQNVLRHLKN